MGAKTRPRRRWRRALVAVPVVLAVLIAGRTSRRRC